MKKLIVESVLSKWSLVSRDKHVKGPCHSSTQIWIPKFHQAVLAAERGADKPKSSPGIQVCQSSRHPVLREPKEHERCTPQTGTDWLLPRTKWAEQTFPEKASCAVIIFCSPLWQFVPASSYHAIVTERRVCSLPCHSVPSRTLEGWTWSHPSTGITASKRWDLIWKIKRK